MLVTVISKVLDMFGWVGSILLAFCAVPEVIVTLDRGYTTVSWGMLLAWLCGEIFVLIPIWFQVKKKYLLFNYIINIILISILVVYKGG